MNLWIRSQKKTNLIKVEHIFIDDKKSRLFPEDTGTKIVTPCDNEMSVVLGRYKSEERALEILDDIEMLLCGNTMRYGLVKGVGIRSDSTKNLIYEMPEE